MASPPSRPTFAVALASSGRKVGLVDADVYGPSQPTPSWQQREAGGGDDRLIPVEAHGLRFLSLGQLVAPGHALAWRGPMATGALARLIEADWGDCELLVDLPPGTGDVQLSLIQKARPAGALIVSTPQDLSLIDATRAIDLFRKMDVPVLGLVENMAGYVCPHCGERRTRSGAGARKRRRRRSAWRSLGACRCRARFGRRRTRALPIISREWARSGGVRRACAQPACGDGNGAALKHWCDGSLFRARSGRNRRTDAADPGR